MDTKLLFIVAIILAVMIVYNYYLVIQQQEHIETLTEMLDEQQGEIKKYYEKINDITTRLIKNNQDKQHTIELLENTNALLGKENEHLNKQIENLKEDLK